MQNENVTTVVSGLQGWHSAQEYQYLLQTDRVGWAWQWLRRNKLIAERLKYIAGNKDASAISSGSYYGKNCIDWELMFRVFLG